jgi:hypothetical protein
LPVKTVTVSSASKRIHPSSLRLLRRLNGTFAGTGQTPTGMAARRSQAPAKRLRECLRESLKTLIAPAPWPANGPYDPVVGAAAAKLVRKRVLDLLFAGFRFRSSKAFEAMIMPFEQ